MEYGYVIILAIIINLFLKTDTYLKGIPRDTEVKVNDSTYMNCSTSLLANQVQWRHGKYYVYTGIAILEPYNDGRFKVEINTSTGACNLVIRSVQPSDAGRYECVEDEGFGEQNSAQLIVLDDDPVCKSYIMHSDGVIGPNSCGIEPEEVKLSCSTTFHGNSLPVLQWKANGDNQSITDGLFNVTSINNMVTYTMTVKSTLGANNSSYICQTTRTSDKHYSCSSDALNILYVFGSKVTVNLTMNDEVNCSANTSQSCSFKWKWFSGDDISTESDNQILKPKKVGWHRCEASCSIRDKSCTVQSMRAKVYSDSSITEVYSETVTNGQNRTSLLALLLVPALALIIGVIIYCTRKRITKKRQRDEIELKREHEEKQRLLVADEPKLFRTLIPKAASNEKKAVFGVTILGEELFVLSYGWPEIEVFDLQKLDSRREFLLTGHQLDIPWDIQSSSKYECLYIVNTKRSEDQSTDIAKIDSQGIVQRTWATECTAGRLSVTYEFNIIVTSLYDRKIMEYSYDGNLIRLIELPKESDADRLIVSPWVTLMPSKDKYIICHGNRGDTRHGVCICDPNGNIQYQFGSQKGSNNDQLYVPVHMVAYSDGHILVADKDNRRVVLLSPELKFITALFSHGDCLRFFNRICLDESNKRLFVAGNIWISDARPSADGRLLVFDMSSVQASLKIAVDKN